MLRLFASRPPGITQQKAVNMQSRLISFPRSPVQKRAPCVNMRFVCRRVNICRWVAARISLIFAQELTRLCARLHLAKKYSSLIHSSLEKAPALELLEHLSSGGFNRRVCMLHLKVHSSLESSPKPPPTLQTQHADSRPGLLALIPGNPLCLCYQIGLDWYLYVGLLIYWLNF